MQQAAFKVILQRWLISDPARDSAFGWMIMTQTSIWWSGLFWGETTFIGNQINYVGKSRVSLAAEFLECLNAVAPLRKLIESSWSHGCFWICQRVEQNTNHVHQSVAKNVCFVAFFCAKFITSCVDFSFSCDCCSLQFYKLFSNICSKWFIVCYLQSASWLAGKIVHFLFFARLGFFTLAVNTSAHGSRVAKWREESATTI